MEITNVHAREILDSRGNPTVEVEIEVEESVIGRAAVPSGASTGSHEARELRDADSKRYLGKGVLTAVRNVNTTIAESLLGWDALDQISIDRKLIELDGTAQKSDLGANAMLGVSLAVARAAAEGLGQPLFRYLGGAGATELPVPLMNILNGGAHADNGLEIQEFMVVPHGFTSFSESLRAGVEVFHTLKALLKSKGLATSVGDEGGFAPRLDTNEKAIELVCESIVKAGFKLGAQVSIALDCAASEFYDGKTKSYTFDKQVRSGDQLVTIYQDLAARYPIVSIEDGCAEDDWTTWKSLTNAMADSVQLVGDDLFVTNKTRLIEGIQKKIANAILVKVNQIGTLTETLEAMKIARLSGYASIVSHRSGETEDHFIADLAVATSAGQIKTGSASRSDRLAKYNQLLRIEEMLGKQATFGESSPFKSRAL